MKKTIEKKTTITRFSRAFLLVLFITAGVAAGDAGTRGLAFLKVDVDSRAAAMGGAYTALSADASSAFWNPAGLARAVKSSFILMHNEWLFDLSQEFAALQFHTGRHNLAAAVNIMRIPDIEIRDEVPTEDPAGKVDALNMSTSISYGTLYRDTWQLGLSVKYLFERYYLESAHGWAVDLGVQRKHLFPGIDWGFVIQNLGRMGALKSQKTALPVMLRTGVGYRVPFVQNLLAALEVQHIFDERTHLRLGAEYQLHPAFVLRGGFISGMEDLGLTAGISVIWADYHFDYAYVPFRYDLGASHRLTFGVHF